MKTVPHGLATHLARAVTALATCWRITRTDGVVFRFTDHDQDLVVEGEVYQASAAYSRTAISNDAGMGVDNLDVEGVFDSEAVTEEELRAGLFDRAEVRIFLVNWADPSMGALRLRRGWFGEVVLTEQGVFRTELRGLTQALQQRIGELYSPECRADLGDQRCRVPVWPAVIARETAYTVGAIVRVRTSTAPTTVGIPFVNPGFGAGSLVGWTVVSGSAAAKTASGALGPRTGTHFLEGGNVASFELRQTVDLADLLDTGIYRCVGAGSTAVAQPVYDTAVGQQTTDGSAVFEAMEAWSRAGIVTDVVDRAMFTASIDEPRAVDGWFAGGVLTWESGANAGRAIEVNTWEQAAGRLELLLPMGYAIRVGDLFRLHPGCDKRLDTCIERFANVLNFRGEPYVPGQDSLMAYADAS